MADIAMCRGEGCDRREKCYRYTAPINRYRQTVFYHQAKDCEWFWDNTGKVDGREIGQWWERKELNKNELDSNVL